MTITIRPGTTIRPGVSIKGFSTPAPVETVTLVDHYTGAPGERDYYAGSSATRNGTAISILGHNDRNRIAKLLLLEVGDTITMTTNLGTFTVTLATVFTTSDGGSYGLYYNATSVESAAFSSISGDIIFDVPII